MASWIDSRRFALHPAVLHGKRIVAKLEQQLGRSRHDWRDWLAQEGIAGPVEIDAFLQKSHKMGRIQCRIFRETAFGEHPENYQEAAYFKMAPIYIAQQYSGKKESLQSLYAQCIALISELGADVRFSPCKTYVPVYRNHVIAQIIPATQKRIDLGLALGELPATGALKSTGGFAKGDRITHKWRLNGPEDLSETCVSWLQKAYTRDV